MMDLAALALWDAQDALKTALGTELGPLGVSVDLGLPSTIRPEHVWIIGSATGSAEYEETGPDPSRLTFILEVAVLCTYAAVEYETTRDRLKTILTAVSSALAAFSTASVDQARVGDWTVDEGRNGSGHRQIGMTLEIACDTWIPALVGD